MAIKVTCPNGHILRVNDSLAGKTGLCPTCKARVTVPEPPRDSLDESDILQVIGPYDPGKSHSGQPKTPLDGPAEEKSSKVEMRRCMSCEREIEAETHICPYCHHYIGGVGDFG